MTACSPILRSETLVLTDQEKQQIEACRQTLNACDKALNKAKKVIKDQTVIIELHRKQVKELAEQNVELQSERDSILKNPILWLLVGIAGGVLIGGVISR